MGVLELSDVFDRQLELQVKAYGNNPQAMSVEDSITFIAWNQQAIVAEAVELLAEVGWKPWAVDRFVNREGVGHELVDILHFMVNIALAIGWTADDMIAGYFAKAAVNQARQEAVYEHGSMKCPTCGRAEDEPT